MCDPEDMADAADQMRKEAHEQPQHSDENVALSYAAQRRMLKAALYAEFAAKSDETAEHLYDLADEIGVRNVEAMVEAITEEVASELHRRVERLGGNPYRTLGTARGDQT